MGLLHFKLFKSVGYSMYLYGMDMDMDMDVAVSLPVHQPLLAAVSQTTVKG